MQRGGGSIKNLMATMQAEREEQERVDERRMAERVNPAVEEDQGSRPAA